MASSQRRGKTHAETLYNPRHNHFLTEGLLHEPLLIIGLPCVLAILLGWSLFQLQAARETCRKLQEQSKRDVMKQEQQIESEDSQEEVINRIKQEWEVDRNRIQILEKARAASVKDVTAALAAKRNAEFEVQDLLEKMKSQEKDLNSKNAEVDEMQNLSYEKDDEIENLRQEKRHYETEWQNLKKKFESEGRVKMEENEIVQDNIESIAALKQKLKLAEEEIKTVKEYAKSEIGLMTLDLIRVRDEKATMTEQAENLTIDLSEAERKVEEFEKNSQQLVSSSAAKVAGSETDDAQEIPPFSEQYIHEMRAEAALIVEEIEDKASLDLEHAMKKSQIAEKTAFQGLMKAAKAKEKAKKFKDELELAKKQIEKQQKQIWYLKDQVRVLISKTNNFSELHKNIEPENN